MGGYKSIFTVFEDTLEVHYLDCGGGNMSVYVYSNSPDCIC